MESVLEQINERLTSIERKLDNIGKSLNLIEQCFDCTEESEWSDEHTSDTDKAAWSVAEILCSHRYYMSTMGRTEKEEHWDDREGLINEIMHMSDSIPEVMEEVYDALAPIDTVEWCSEGGQELIGKHDLEVTVITSGEYSSDDEYNIERFGYDGPHVVRLAEVLRKYATESENIKLVIK